MADKPDDLEAVRNLVEILGPFDSVERERILRWSREKLGLPAETAVAPSGTSGIPAPATITAEGAKDIKSFVAEKQPKSDNQFAATVAHYYRFVAPEANRKESITGDDLQEACRLAGRNRLPKPGQTLINAHAAGLLDKADRGSYAISTVGENLVAVTLPSGAAPSGPRSVARRKPAKTNARKPAKPPTKNVPKAKGRKKT